MYIHTYITSAAVVEEEEDELHLDESINTIESNSH